MTTTTALTWPTVAELWAALAALDQKLDRLDGQLDLKVPRGRLDLKVPRGRPPAPRRPALTLLQGDAQTISTTKIAIADVKARLDLTHV